MAGTDKTDDGWQRIAGSTQVLVRSRIEIAVLLNEVMQSGSPLSAFFIGNEALFLSQLRYVDPQEEYLLVDYSNNRMANSALLAAPKITFSCSHKRGGIEFLGVQPGEAMHEGMPAVRICFPDSLVLCQRRAHRRVKLLPELPLHCVADAGGVLPFDCKITDISRGGCGTVVYDSTVNLVAGEVLKGCRIAHPNGTVIEVDIEIRHCSRMVLPDGTSVQRAGCSFIGDTSGIEELIKVFVFNMERLGQD